MSQRPDIEIAASWHGRVDRSGGPRACWPWTGACMTNGYGQSRIRKDGRWRGAGAHQIAHYVATGQWERLADGRVVRHLCRNRVCCNPAHLVGGTHAENSDDRQAHDRGESLLPSPVEASGTMPPNHDQWIDLRLAARAAANDRRNGELRTRLRRRVVAAANLAFPDLSPVPAAVTRDFCLVAWSFAVSSSPTHGDSARLALLADQLDQVIAASSEPPLFAGAAA